MTNGRTFDPKTLTWAYSDGSGRITEEQIFQRKLLKDKIALEKNSIKKANYIIKFLTFFSK